jgi:hypothetical protein
VKTAAFYSAGRERYRNAPPVRKAIFAWPPKKKSGDYRYYWIKENNVAI